MHGPTATLDELADGAVPEGGWRRAARRRASSTTRSARAWRRACSASSRRAHPRVLERMIDLKVGKGPYFTLLPALSPDQPRDAALGRARRALQAAPTCSRSTGRSPRPCAVAKRDLAPGDTLGMIGETRLSRLRHDLAGRARSAARCRSASPSGAKVIKPIKAGECLTYENCVPDDSMVVTQIRRRSTKSDATTSVGGEVMASGRSPQR